MDNIMHHAFGMAAEAITSLEQVVTIQTNAVFVHGKLGACYQMLDQWQQALNSYRQVYEEVAQGVGQSSCKRFMQMLEIELGMHAPQYADPRQRPFESYMPGLPSQPWFERGDFNWSDALEAQSEVLTQEFVQAVDNEVGVRPYVRGSKGAGDWSNLADSLQWSSLHLYENDRGQS